MFFWGLSEVPITILKSVWLEIHEPQRADKFVNIGPYLAKNISSG